MHGQLLAQANVPLTMEEIVPNEDCIHHGCNLHQIGSRLLTDTFAVALVDFGPVSPQCSITSRYVKGVIAARLPRTRTTVVEPGLTSNQIHLVVVELFKTQFASIMACVDYQVCLSALAQLCFRKQRRSTGPFCRHMAWRLTPVFYAIEMVSSLAICSHR